MNSTSNGTKALHLTSPRLQPANRIFERKSKFHLDDSRFDIPSTYSGGETIFQNGTRRVDQNDGKT